MATAGRVLDAAALIMRAVASGGENAAAPMREAALTEGAMLHHLAVGMSRASVRPSRQEKIYYLGLQDPLLPPPKALCDACMTALSS